MTRVRLQRFLAQAGVASRRKSEDLISAGLVEVNGQVVTKLGTTVDPVSDEVVLKGRRVTARFAEVSPGSAIGIALHKPAGVLTARSDPGRRPTVYDLIREPEGERLIYIGRLDLDTEGLLLLTTHGRLAHRLTHPRWEVEREYRAEVGGPLDGRRLADAARRGIVLEDGRAGPFRCRIVGRSGERRTLELVLTEGRKREVRRIVEACGGRVERLVRTRFAFVTLTGLEAGRWRRLAREEMARLLALVDLPATEGSRHSEEGPWT
ncbi:MAG TPA: pseudouridine synthase [Gemmatimonadota bacterium]|nr:pseudouridine synthase [Gemmatimonadota bacterium]